jgi:hypothetical protein
VAAEDESLDPRAPELVAAHDAQLRARVPRALPAGEVVDSDGPLLRFSGGPGGGWVLYRDLGGLEGAALDKLISRQVSFFARRGERFEWKYYGHDLPPDLPERLLAAGFVSEPTETIVIAPVADIAAEPRVPEGVSLREVTARTDFERGGAGSTAPPSRTEQTWPRSAASAISKQTLPTTAARFWSGSASSR